jgi:hypothetical protein
MKRAQQFIDDEGEYVEGSQLSMELGEDAEEEARSPSRWKEQSTSCATAPQQRCCCVVEGEPFECYCSHFSAYVIRCGS